MDSAGKTADTGGLLDQCEAVLTRNWHEGTMPNGTDFAYTAPSKSHYPWQWYWDSCFHAIAWRNFDTVTTGLTLGSVSADRHGSPRPFRPLHQSRSERELRSLLGAQRDDGFIGHTIFWDRPLPRARRPVYNFTGRSRKMTASIQPPLLAWAWSLAVGSPTAEPRILKQHVWLQENRDLDGDGLIWILQPDESGLDASPQFDPIWGRECHGLPGFFRLVGRNRRLGYDLRRAIAAGSPVCAEVATNVLYSLSRTALGLPSLTDALIERCYDERRGLFMPLTHRPVSNAPIPVTWAALAPLALPDLPEQIGHRLVREHLLNPDEFWLPAGIPSVSRAEPSFLRDDRGPLFGYPHRYWRGPVWLNANWLLWLGLVRLGYLAEAHEVASRMAATVAGARGLYEYYDPVDGSPQGQPRFSWSALLAEVLT